MRSASFSPSPNRHPLIFLEDFLIGRNKHHRPLIFLRGFPVIGKNKHRHPLIFLRGFLVSSKVFSESDTFSIPNFSKLILFSIPKFFETNTKFSETDTFFDTKKFRNRYRYFFLYQIFPKPIPKLFSIPKFSETDTDTIKKNQKVSKPRSFETEMPNSVSDALFIYCGGVRRTRGVQIGIFVVFQWTHSFTPPFPSCCPYCHHCQRRIYSNIFKYLHRRIYSYSVDIFKPNIFVFVFGFYF